MRKAFTLLIIAAATTACSPDPDRFGDIEALTLCQMTLRQVAVDPETADVPYVQRFGSGNEYYYAWGRSTKFARMKNRLGLEGPVSASCIVDGVTRRITSLTIDGKSVIGP